MGKIVPSLRASKIPFPLLKRPPPTTTDTAEAPPPPPARKPYIPPNPNKPKKHKKPKPPAAAPTIFTSPSLSAAKQAYDALLSSAAPAPLTLASHNALLRSYAALSADPLHPISLLRHMLLRSPSLAPDHSTFHLLFSAPAPTPQAISAIISFMIDSQCAPNPATLDIAVRALCDSGRVAESIPLIKDFSAKYAPADEFTYNFLVRRLCRVTSSMPDVYRAIEDLKGGAGLKPNIMTYTILIDEVLGRRKNLREAMRLIDELRKAGLKADCYLYNTMMKAYCVMGECSESIGVYKKMMEEGVEPDVVTFNTLVYGLSKVGRVDEARKYMDAMVDMGKFPDAVTYTSLMNGMCRKGQAIRALALLKEMEEKGCEPNECTYNTLLHGLCKGKHMEKAMELYGGMKMNGLKLNGPSYSTLVRVLCRDGRIGEAYSVFDYARESKSLTDFAAYEQLESSLKWMGKMKL